MEKLSTLKVSQRIAANPAQTFKFRLSFNVESFSINHPSSCSTANIFFFSVNFF